MLRALLLILNPSKTWEAIKNEQHGVARISFAYFLPWLLLASFVQARVLTHFGVERGDQVRKTVQVSSTLALRYEIAQGLLLLIIVYLGAVALKAIGVSFHRRHSYTECFTTLAYSLSPLLLARMVDALPANNAWACYGIGVFLALSLLYRGLPFILRPDPSNALGLFLFCSLLLLVITGLAQYLASLVLDEKIFA